MKVLSKLPKSVQSLAREISKFGAVGLVGTAVDFSVFNLLRFFGSNGEGVLFDQPLTAKVVSVVLATMVTFTGNLLWTYRHRQGTRQNIASSYILFFVFNAIGLSFALACLWVSHYLLGLTSALADNISANVIGLGLGTIFRFWAYRKWVFRA